MKTPFLFTVLLLILNGLQAQPTIKATGGLGKNINWAQIKKEEESGDVPGFFYNDCAQGVEIVAVSSNLNPQGKNNYKSENLTDNSPMTAWVEGNSGDGIGEWFEVKSYNVNTIYNGYQATPASFINNSRVKKFKVYLNKKPICFLELTDEMGVQHFELPATSGLSPDKPGIFRFEIVEIYKGTKWTDVCISHVDNVACCFMENTMIATPENTTLISKLSNNQKVYTVDLQNNQTKVSEVLQVSTAKHLKMILLKTKTKSVELTPDHPVFVKNIGFVSIKKLSFLTHCSFDELVNQYEILVWNETLQQTEFESIQKITEIEGVFDTYTIRKIENGNTYIANGIVTKTY